MLLNPEKRWKKIWSSTTKSKGSWRCRISTCWRPNSSWWRRPAELGGSSAKTGFRRLRTTKRKRWGEKRTYFLNKKYFFGQFFSKNEDFESKFHQNFDKTLIIESKFHQNFDKTLLPKIKVSLKLWLKKSKLYQTLIHKSLFYQSFEFWVKTLIPKSKFAKKFDFWNQSLIKLWFCESKFCQSFD